GRAAGEFDDGAMAGGGIVADDGGRRVVVAEDDVEVAVAIEIGESGAEADALLVESPIFGYVGEVQVAEVAEGEEGFVARARIFPDVGASGEGGGDVLFVDEIGVDEVADHAGRGEGVEKAVVVEVGQAGCPGPTG